MSGATAWNAQAYRLTAFPIESGPYGTAEWWEALVGQPPETAIARPRKGGVLESAPLNSGALSLEVELDRLHWRLSAREDSDSTIDELPTLGGLGETLDTFKSLMLGWLKLAGRPTFERIAFGSSLVLPVPDRATGYRILDDLLADVRMDPDGSSDFHYQINRARQSGSIDGIQINRLSRWSVITRLSSTFRVTSDGVKEVPGKSLTGCMLDLDINTARESPHEFGEDEAIAIFEELVSLALEISESGDIP